MVSSDDDDDDHVVVVAVMVMMIVVVVVVLVGPTGSGKGTQAEMLARKYNLVYGSW